MIDVSRLIYADPCPRCLGRRVYAINEDANQWCCAENARPFPFRDQLIFHDAAPDDAAAEIEMLNAAQRQMDRMIYGR